ncbi:MAG: SDR family oxidoreductase [Melioribacteraceae bacterium]
MKTVLITGASGGIGKEFAILFAKKKFNLILVARSEDKLNSLANELETKYKIKANVIVSDLSKQDSPKKLYEEVRSKNISVDVLINNAGFGDFGKIANGDLPKYLQMINLNIVALTELTGLFVKDMLKRKEGRILNVASTASFQPVPNFAVYAATKSYVLSFTEALHYELKGTGVSASALCPGPTTTGFEETANMGSSKLFSSGVMDAKTVATIGYEQMMKNKMTIIPGFRNKVLAFASNTLPSRKLLVAISSFISKEK